MVDLKYIKVIFKGDIIADKVEVADTPWRRLKGLLGRDKLSQGEGMLLYPCSRIHCFGMKFNIDVLFLDKDKKVLALKEVMKPGETAQKQGAYYTLELTEGIIREKGINEGDVFEW